MIEITEIDEEDSNSERLSFSAGMNSLCVVEEGSREDSQDKWENLIKGNHV